MVFSFMMLFLCVLKILVFIYKACLSCFFSATILVVNMVVHMMGCLSFFLLPCFDLVVKVVV
jgi:hypothetical protein